MAVSLEAISLKRCIDYANDVIELCGLHISKISSIQDFNSSFFVSLFEHITDHTVPDLLLSEDSFTEAHNIQAVIDTISLDFLGLSLAHITGEAIVSGNVVSIINLLEVLEAIFESIRGHVHDKREESYDVSASEESSMSSSTDGHINEGVTLVNSSPENEENIPHARVITRKTCRNTLNKHHHHVPKQQADHAISVPYHSERKTNSSGNLKPPLKRRNSKPVETVYKRANVEGIEDLYESNFEKKVKALLENDESPVIHAREMRRKYIQSLKAPLKITSISPCKKSFLLPHNLRPKSKSQVRQHHIRKKTSKREREKLQLYENIRTQSESNVQNSETPAAIQSLLKEFPGFQFPENSLGLLKKHYYRHISSIHKQLKDTLMKKPTIVKQTEKAMEEEAKLSKILTKDLQEKEHLRKINQHKAVENRIKASLRDARMQSVKMRQYFEKFHKSMSKKLGNRNFSEEVLIEKTFKEMLDLQKEKVRLICKRVQEADDNDAVQHRKYLDALKNVYLDQLDLLAETVKAEQKESIEREKAKRLAIDKMNQEILKTLQKEVQSLQKDVLDMMKDIHFPELDAQNVLQNCQLLDL